MRGALRRLRDESAGAVQVRLGLLRGAARRGAAGFREKRADAPGDVPVCFRRDAEQKRDSLRGEDAHVRLRVPPQRARFAQCLREVTRERPLQPLAHERQGLENVFEDLRLSRDLVRAHQRRQRLGGALKRARREVAPQVPRERLQAAQQRLERVPRLWYQSFEKTREHFVLVQHEHRQALTQRLGLALEVGEVRAAVELGALHQRLVEETRASLQRVDAQCARRSVHVHVHLGDALREILEDVRPSPRRASPENGIQILILGRGGGRDLRLCALVTPVAALEVPELRLDELSVVLAFLALGHAQVGVDEPPSSFVRHLLRRFALLPSAGLGRHRCRGGPDAKRAGSPPVDALAGRARTGDTRAPPMSVATTSTRSPRQRCSGVPHRRPRGNATHPWAAAEVFLRRRYRSRFARRSGVRPTAPKIGFGVLFPKGTRWIGGSRVEERRLFARSPFRSRAWHARRPPVDLRERSHHGACLFATPSHRSRPRLVARVGRGPEPPTDDASRLLRGLSHELKRNPRRAPWPGGRRSTAATHGRALGSIGMREPRRPRRARDRLRSRVAGVSDAPSPARRREPIGVTLAARLFSTVSRDRAPRLG